MPSSPSSFSSSRRRALGLLAAATLGAGAALLSAGCDDAASGIEFCDVDADCAAGRSCVEGLCVELVDTALPDTSGDTGVSPDGSDGDTAPPDTGEGDVSDTGEDGSDTAETLEPDQDADQSDTGDASDGTDGTDGTDADVVELCGNAVLDEGELCDPAIAGGEAGACPTSCTPNDVCQLAGLSGEGCLVECVITGDITACTDADGCCPDGCTSGTDDDCSPVCGNAVLDAGELCDTAIAAGQPGACPADADCVSADACELVERIGTSCQVECAVTGSVSACQNGDGCCASGCNATNDDDCQPTCGNSVVESGELCDTAIADGQPGACPTQCMAANACDLATPVGTGCDTVCMVTGTIVACADGDGCCAPGCTSGNDTDCPPGCGNGVLDPGEQCDTGIAAGAGSCPSQQTCQPADACENATIQGSACAATCVLSDVSACQNGDGCCAPGCNATNDDDCQPTCGNSVVESGETCDTGIPSGAGSCPTNASCVPANSCQTATLQDAGTCTASCTRASITVCADNDGCCAPGCNANNDGDCSAVCGNSVVESGEQCDDGNTTPSDGCSATCQNEAPPLEAFRFTDLDLRDPHIYVLALGLFCADGTSTANDQLQTAITMDGDGDGDYDLGLVSLFRPLVHPTATARPFEAGTATCLLNPAECGPDPLNPLQATTYTSFLAPATPCLAPASGTFRSSYSPAIVRPQNTLGNGCFVSANTTISVTLGGVVIPLSNAQIAAEFDAIPASGLRRGLLRGFLTTAVAASITLDVGNGPQSLSSLLPGGQGNCASHDDRDDLDGNGTDDGWWFYLNFTADKTVWTGP